MPEQTKTNLSVLKNLIEGFNFQNSRYYDIVNKAASFGHTLLDTIEPTSKPESEKDTRPTGIVTELDKALQSYKQYNDSMDSIMEKMHNLI